MHLAVLIQVFQLLLCSGDDTGTISVSNKQETMIVSEVHYNKHMLFAGWEVHIVKNCYQGLENAA